MTTVREAHPRFEHGKALGVSQRGENKERTMKGVLVTCIGLLLSQASVGAQVRDVDLGVSVSDGRLRSFYLAIGDHYHVPPPQIVQIRDRYRLPEDELPVVFFLATRARVEPSAIINLRIRKMSWLDISFHYGLTPDIYFVPLVVGRVGPPYGNAYGYYRKYGPAKDWKKIRLTDREVVDLVNLKFMAEHHKMAPEDVIAMRGRKNGFVVINDEIRKQKESGKPEKENLNQKGKGNTKKKS